MPDADVDVVLMTIHQSKGLEWDAVAVVGMQDKTFPSNQGDSLTVELDGDHAGGMRQGRWQVPEYHETAKTWLEHAQAVPVPVRADAGILPRFPHDAAGTGDSAAGDTHDPYGLDALDTVERLNAEINGNDIAAFDDANGIERDEGEADFLSQHEEYGRRLHADERRLVYVALTRAREDALLTYHQNNAIARDTSSAAMSKSAAKPSNFWQEVRDCLMMRPDVAKPSAGDEQVPKDSLTGRGVAMPEGFFVGERAGAYMQSVVDGAWSEPVDESQTGELLPWPIGTSPRITEMLSKSAGIVRAAINDATAVAAGTSDAADMTVTDATSGADGGAVATAQGPLLLRARMLTEDRYLMPWSLSDGSSEGDFGDLGDLDAVVRRRGARILARMRHNVTALQASAGLMDQRKERAYLLGLVRPVPQIASPRLRPAPDSMRGPNGSSTLSVCRAAWTTSIWPSTVSDRPLRRRIRRRLARSCSRDCVRPSVRRRTPTPMSDASCCGSGVWRARVGPGAGPWRRNDRSSSLCRSSTVRSSWANSTPSSTGAG